MHFQRVFILCILFLISHSIYTQTGTGKLYRIDRYESIYLPLGKISFADKLVEYKVGNPPPIQKYRDSIQCLNEPNYKKYRIPDFVSLGCGGSLTIEFTDNGFMNLKGNDLYIFEVGPSKESAQIEISQNGVDWIYVGKIFGGKSTIDLSDSNIDSNNVFYFVRITDLKKLCKSKSSGADIDAVGAINSVIKLTIIADVLFNVAEFELKGTAQESLEALTTTIQQVNKATILVEGYTDSDGTEEDNLDLSEKRCLSVVETLKSRFGEGSLYNYEIKYFGESNPRAPNDSKANKQINRRVEITVLPPKDYFESLSDKN